jgi:hypothetical protein
MLTSNGLRATLRHLGYAKLAAQVMRDQNEYVGDITSLAGAMKSISVKIAANRTNESVIRKGLVSFRRFQEL